MHKISSLRNPCACLLVANSSGVVMFVFYFIFKMNLYVHMHGDTLENKIHNVIGCLLQLNLL